MSYKPNKESNEIKDLVLGELQSMLSQIQGISTIYVEPGDTLLVTLKGGCDPENVESLRQAFKYLFPDNPGVFLDGSQVLKVEAVKSGET